jgi:CheY-like chemotaxis protein
MGERILREEGFEVVTVTDGQTAMLRLADVDPDLVLADVSLPRVSGYDICRHLKESRRFAHVRVVLTAGLLEKFDDERAVEVKSDGVLKKPFESSALLDLIRPMVDAAAKDRKAPTADGTGALEGAVVAAGAAGDGGRMELFDEERVRAAVTLALDAALPSLIDKITERVLIALGQ